MTYLRRARPEDCQKIWEWRNETGTRGVSLNPDRIPYKKHEKWYAKALKNPDILFLVVSNGYHEIGYVRIMDGEVSIAIDHNQRCKHYGSDALSQVSWGRSLTAIIKVGNARSVKAFKRAGYVIESTGPEFIIMRTK